MKKKLLTLAVALLAATGAWAQTTFTADNLKYKVTDAEAKTVELTGYETEPTGALTIPATVTNESTEYSVTSIGSSAFRSCSSLTAVTIPASVTNIGSSAFAYCSSLTAVTISDGVTSIGNYAFYCSALTAIHVAEGNTAYSSEDGVLFNKDKTTLVCYPIGKPETTYTVPAGVTSIAKYAFAGSNALTEVTLPEGLTEIAEYAFAWCRNLTKISLPESLESIGNVAFNECTGLTEMTVLATTPPTVGSMAFNSVSRTIPVYVPAASLATYQTAAVWNEFTDLQAISTTGLQTPAMPESIRMQGGMLHNPQQLHLTLYDMQGRQVYSGNDATISLNAGVYVLRCAGASGKVVF